MTTYIAEIKNQATMGIENLHYFYALFTKLLSHFWAKLLISLAFVPALLFNPELKEAMAALAILIIIDFFSGVMTAKKTGDQITSAKIFRTALKFAVYFSLIAAGRLTVVAGLPFLPADAIILGFLAVTELISVIENAGRSGFAVPQKLLNQLQNYRDKQ